MRILILKFAALGDVIRTSYILPGLHEKYDNPVIDWVTSNAACELLRFNPYIRILASPQSGLDFLENNQYDLLLSFDDEYEVLELIKKARYKKIIGAYLEGASRRYSSDSAEWFDMGLISRYGKKIADDKKKKNTREHNEIFQDILQIQIREGIFFNSLLLERKIAASFDKSVFNIGINPSAGMRWKSKEMPFAEVCRLIELLSSCVINNKKVKIHLLGGAAEEKRNNEIKNHVSRFDVKDQGGFNTLLEFAAIVAGCDYIISSDSLALHLAIAQKVPSLSYFTPTSANEIGTFGTGVKVTAHSIDYCNYRSDADNSTITADRIFNEFKLHCLTLNYT